MGEVVAQGTLVDPEVRRWVRIVAQLLADPQAMSEGPPCPYNGTLPSCAGERLELMRHHYVQYIVRAAPSILQLWQELIARWPPVGSNLQ